MLNFVIAMQVIEIMGILPKGVCGSARSNELMDPQFTDYFPSETESESESGYISQFPNYFTKYRLLRVSGTEIPWFNHQSVENNSILFWVGRKFPKLALYFSFGTVSIACVCHVDISINGCKKSEGLDQFRIDNNLLRLCFLPQRLLQYHLNKSNPTDQNYVEITYETRCGANAEPLIKATRWGVHVECICPPQESGIPNLPLLTAGQDDDDVDYWSELPFYGSDDLEAEEEEYQSPLVLNDTSRSCMSWLVGPTTMLFSILLLGRFLMKPRTF